ncbi:MAG TPA: hypothetical protein PKY59_11715, partial [Pyrinomonadaceae bacterium]|nr:hypothetical protein [Pyrinomonadaceae bacterium]
MNKFKNLTTLLALFFLVGCFSVFAQTTAFSYQGKLNDGASAANGTYQMEFELYDAVSGGAQVGSTVSLNSVAVANGVFNVELDFGANAFAGGARFLSVKVKKAAEPSFTTLTPRQPISSTPYAVRSLNATNVETTTAGNSVINAINDGATNVTINENRLPSNIVRINPTAAQTAPAAGDTDAVVNVDGSSTTYPSTFKVNNDGALLLKGTYDGGVSSGGVPVEGPGTRMVWHPRKGAFRAGWVNTNSTGVFDPTEIFSTGTQWDEANIGYNSIAVGENVRASGDNSVAFGKNSTAAQVSAVAIGEYAIASGAASVAMGYHAHTNARQGSFVFSDRSSVDVFRAGVNHSSNWRVSGGFRIFTSSNLSTGVTIQSGASVSNWGQSNAVISTSTGALLSTGGVWTNASSRKLKDNFQLVDSREVLQKVLNLPIQTWNYKSENANIRHIGP